MTYLGVSKLQRGGGQKSAYQTSGMEEERGDEQLEPGRSQRWWKQLVIEVEKEGAGQAGAMPTGERQGTPGPEATGMQGCGHPGFLVR